MPALQSWGLRPRQPVLS